MKLNGVHHIAVSTLDIDQSLQFYTEMLGFKEESRADMGPLTLVYLKVADGCYMELFDLRGACVKGEKPEEVQGLRHIAFDVTDIEQWNADLKAKQADFVMELELLGPIGKNCLMIRDPNGVVVELCENA